MLYLHQHPKQCPDSLTMASAEVLSPMQLCLFHTSATKMTTTTLSHVILQIILISVVWQDTITCRAFSKNGRGATNKSNVEYRRGKASDNPIIAWTLAKNFQNPLGISAASSYLIAVNVDNENDDKTKVVGWAQIRQLGTAQRNPGRYDARPGSYDLEQDVDDQMWEEFENDNAIQIPTGFASLPWSKEYRALEANVAKRQARREELVEQRKQERRKTQTPIWELNNVYVDPGFRGVGIGTELVQRLCQEYQDTGKALSNLYLLTNTPKFYQRLNLFEEVTSPNEIPAKMILGYNDICMRGKD